MKHLLFLLLFTFPSLAKAVASEGETVSLSAAMFKNANIPEGQAQEQIEKIARAIKAELLKGNTVEFKGLGQFYLQTRHLTKKNPENPNKPTEVVRKYPRFKTSELFKSEINLQKTP